MLADHWPDYVASIFNPLDLQSCIFLILKKTRIEHGGKAFYDIIAIHNCNQIID